MQQGNSNLIRFVRWPKSSLATTTALSSSELSFIEKIHSSMRRKKIVVKFSMLDHIFSPNQILVPYFSQTIFSQSNFLWSIFSLDCFSDFVLPLVQKSKSNSDSTLKLQSQKLNNSSVLLLYYLCIFDSFFTFLMNSAFRVPNSEIQIPIPKSKFIS